MSLLCNMLSRFVIAFLPRSKCLLILCLQSLSAVILEPKKIKSVSVSAFSPSVCHEVMGPDAMIFVFWTLSFKPGFSLLFHPHQERGSLFLQFLPTEWYHLHIWGCWYFSQNSWFQLMIHPAQHFIWGSDGKESTYNAGNPSLILGLGRSPGEGNGNPLWYIILAWRIPWTEEPGRLQFMGCKESDMTVWLTLSFSLCIEVK